MKALILLTFVMISNSISAACENLNGNYLCKAGSRTMEKSISVMGNEVLMSTDGVDSKLVLDNQVRDVPATENQREGKVTASCDKGSIVVDFKTILVYEGSDIGKQIQQTIYSKSGTGMIVTIRTKARGVPLPKMNYTCRPI